MVGRRKVVLPQLNDSSNTNITTQTPQPSAYVVEAAKSLPSSAPQVSTSIMSKGESLPGSSSESDKGDITSLPVPAPPPPPVDGAVPIRPPPGQAELTKVVIPKPPPMPKMQEGTQRAQNKNQTQADAEENGSQIPVEERMTETHIGQWSLPKHDLARATEEVKFIIERLISTDIALSTGESKILQKYIKLLNRATMDQDQGEDFKVRILKVFFDCKWSGFLADYLKVVCNAETSDVGLLTRGVENLCDALAIMQPISALPAEVAAEIFDQYFGTIFDGLRNPNMMKVAGGSLDNPLYDVLGSLMSTLQDFVLVKFIRDDKLSSDDKVKVKVLLTEYSGVLWEGKQVSIACYRALNFLDEDPSPFPQFSIYHLNSVRCSKDNMERCVEDIEYVIKRLASVSIEDLMTQPWRYQYDFGFILDALPTKSQLSSESKSRILVALHKDGIWHKTVADLYTAALGGKSRVKLTSQLSTVLTNINIGLKSIVKETDICEDPVLLKKSFDHVGDILVKHLKNPLAKSGMKDGSFLISPVAAINRSMLSVVCNFSYYYPPSVSVFREKNMIAIARILHEACNDSRVKTCCLLITAYLLNENDSKKIMSIKEDELSYLLQELHKSMLSERASAYHPEELLDGLNRIAVSDLNKLKLMECGVLKLLVKSLDPAKKFSAAHRTAAINVVWNLAFSEEIRKEIKEKELLMTALRSSKDSEHKEIRAAAAGALWQLEGKEKHIADATSSRASKEDQKRHIMLSYNHQAKEEVHKMKDRLKQMGYNVWINTEQIAAGASTLEAMSNAIEESCLVLIFFSEPYKNSVNCRAEAEYVFERQKPFLPVQVQAGYKPDGWLGILFGSKYRYTLSKPDKYESEVSGLMSKVTELTSGQSMTNHVQDTLVSTAAPTFTSALSTNQKAKLECESWSSEQIQEWVKESGLEKYMESLTRLNGKMLTELVRLSCDHKEAFYLVVSKMPQIDMVDILLFSQAVQALVRK